jgi:hypothetical protein
MMELLFSRILAALAAVTLLACIINAFAAVEDDERYASLQDELASLRQAFQGISQEESGKMTLDGRTMLPEGHSVALVGRDLLLRASGSSFPLTELPELQNAIAEAWSGQSRLLICWNGTGTYLYLLKESAILDTAAASLRQSSMELYR